MANFQKLTRPLIFVSVPGNLRKANADLGSSVGLRSPYAGNSKNSKTEDDALPNYYCSQVPLSAGPVAKACISKPVGLGTDATFSIVGWSG